jgi:hypothetical protein
MKGMVATKPYRNLIRTSFGQKENAQKVDVHHRGICPSSKRKCYLITNLPDTLEEADVNR